MHLCEAVPCPPAEEDFGSVTASTHGPTVNGWHEMARK